MGTLDGRGGNDGRQTPAIDQSTRKAIDIIKYLGALYTRIQDDATERALGAYTVAQAIRDREDELGNAETGLIAGVDQILSSVDDFVAQARNTTQEELSPKGVRKEGTDDDSHVSEPVAVAETFADYPLPKEV